MKFLILISIKIPRNLAFFQAQLSLEWYFSHSYILKCQQLLALMKLNDDRALSADVKAFLPPLHSVGDAYL